MKKSFKDKAFISGTFRLFLRKKGERDWIKKVEIHNLVVDLGLNNMRNLLATGSGSIPGQGAFSDDTSAPVAGDTSLGGNEIRKAFLASGDVSISKKVSWEWLAETTDWGAITSISKAGLYTGAAGATLWCAASFTGITVDNTVEVLGSWTLEFGNV